MGLGFDMILDLWGNGTASGDFREQLFTIKNGRMRPKVWYRYSCNGSSDCAVWRCPNVFDIDFCELTRVRRKAGSENPLILSVMSLPIDSNSGRFFPGRRQSLALGFFIAQRSPRGDFSRGAVG